VPFFLRRFRNNGTKDTHLINYNRTLMLPTYPDGLIMPYDITAVVCHLGPTAGGGHYICYVTGENDTCVRLDDHHAAASLPGAAILNLENAYLIFYSVRKMFPFYFFTETLNS
jgi:ubiquitin C-terminal hydrolase